MNKFTPVMIKFTSSFLNKYSLLSACMLFAIWGNTSAQIIWSSTSGTAWLTGSNWTGGVVPGPAQVAQFNAPPSSATTGVGINMDTATGSYATGAISVTSARTNALIIGNSSPTTPGIFTLNGASVSATPNVILQNFASNTARLTIQNTQGGGASTMTLDIGSGSKNIVTGAGTATAAGNTINITTAINGSSALILLGGGTWNALTATGINGGILRLGGSNSFTGGVTVGLADGTQSGILELDTTGAINNFTGNNITINHNSQLYLATSSNSTFNESNVIVHLNGNGNNYSSTGKGALINASGSSYVWDGRIDLASDAGITAAGSASSLTLTANISGPGMLTKQGAGNLVLQGTNNNWAGGTLINAGRLTVSPGSGISAGDLTFAQVSGNLNVTMNNGAQLITALSSSFTSTSNTNGLVLNGTRLTIDQADNTTYGGSSATNTSTITGAGSVVKTGVGRLTLTSISNTFSGGLRLTAGEIRYNPASGTAVANNSPDTLDGGTMSTNGIGRTVTFTFGTLAVTQNSTIDLGTDTLHSIKFANSSAITWTSGKTLTITNWTGLWNGTAGTKGRIYIGTNTTGITAGQLAQIKFRDGSGYLFNAAVLSSGEIVPVAPTITTTAASFGPFCSTTGNAISVAFTYTGPFTSPFLVQLSGPGGTFTNDFTSNIIGSGSSSPITATIPAGTPSGTGYRVRVIAQSPVNTFGSNNGSNINITGTPVLPAITGSSTVPVGGTITLSNTTSGGTWSSNNPLIASINATSGLVTGLSTGTAVITYSYTNFCALTGHAFDTITVIAIPVITSVVPNTAAPGDLITITGARFNATATNNIVFFGAVKANVVSGSSTSLAVTVPAGAAYARLSVTDVTTGQVAYEPYEFTPVFANSGLMADTVNFKPRVNFAAGSLPIGTCLGDLDGDGKPDMVVINSGPNNMYVYRNTSTTGIINTSSFGTPTIVATGLGPHYVKIADLNGDGKPEIIVANTATSSNSISVYRNTSAAGSISFAGKVDFAASSAPIDLSVADLNMDGKPDIAVVCQNSGTLAILKNNISAGIINSASFSSSTVSIAALPYKIYTGDLDNDNKPDIAVTHYGANVITLLHNTSVTAAGIIFSAPVTLATGASPTGIAGGDLNGDGRTDLVVTNSGANTLSLYANNNTVAGTISFMPGMQYATDNVPEDVAVADMNGDGKPDLAIGNYAAGNVSIFRNMATAGAFTASSLAARVNLPTGSNPAGLAWNDIDGDGKPDLAVVSGNSSLVSILKDYPLPPAGTISGADSICVGSPATLAATVAGGTWMSTNTGIATVSGSGVVYGIAPGTDTILYYTVAQGDTNFTSHIITVGSLVTVGAISVTTHSICTGASAAFTNAIAGGAWSSSNPAIATVDSNGFVTGVTAGNTIISYTTTSFCGLSFDTASVHVSPGTGYVIGAISGPPAVCMGSSVVLSDTSAGGSWTSSNTDVAVISGGGTLQGITAGNAVITYSINTACGIYQAILPVIVDTLPDASVINGPANLCVSIPVAFTDAAGPGGTWSVSTGNASVSPTGTVTGLAPGLDTINYHITNSCGSSSGFKEVVITALPDAGTLSGPSVVCKLDTVQLNSTIPGGTWSASNGFSTSLGNGRIRGVNAGADTIRYTIANTCGIDTTSLVVTILAPPVAGTITGATTVCVGSQVTLTDTVSGGIWSSLNGNTIVTGGIVTGINPGTDTIKYTVTNVCGTAVAIKKITINAVTTVDTITGPSTVCTGAKITLANATTGGTWSKTNATASITPGGVVTGVSAGTDTIIYTPAGTCAMIAAKVITIFKSPFTGTITGPVSVCIGSTITLRDTVAGGIWSGTTGNTSVSDSFVTGINAGIDTIRFTISTATCGTTSSIRRITINPLPFAKPITGTSTLNVGDIVQLHDSTSGGSWSVKGLNAIINTQGKLGALKEGIDTVRYMVTNVCGTYTSVFPVNILPTGNSGSISAIQLYPNPTSGQFTVKLSSTVDKSVKVLIAGTDFKIISLTDVNTNTDTPFELELPDGVYYLSALSDKGWFTTKFVIVN